MVFESEKSDGAIRDHQSGLSSPGILLFIVFLAMVAYALVRFLSAPVIESGDAAARSESVDANEMAAGTQRQGIAGRKRCEFFVAQKILSAREPAVLDHWEKDGKRVFQVGFSMPGEKGLRVRLCVYDLEKRAALLPAIGDQDQWKPQDAERTSGGSL